MTRRDYVRIASALRRSQPFADEPHSFEQWTDDVRGIADVLAADNPRFDRSRFFAACASATASLTTDLATMRALDGRDTDAHNAYARSLARCADCGELGERTGHMGCQYPQ